MKFTKIICLLISCAFFASCATQTFGTNANARRDMPANTPNYSQWADFFLYGIGQNAKMNAGELCKGSGGVAFTEAKQTFPNIAISLITFGIYTPTTMSVYCNK